MNAILELANKLRDTSAAIANHERAIASGPTPALEASLRSLQKRMTRLEAEFSAVAAGVGVDVCRYRFVSDYVGTTVNPVCRALLHFQELYTLAYDAVKNGVKQIARISPDVVSETAFGFGYSFSGSLGVVLTFDNKRLGLFENTMDEAITHVFTLAQAKTTAEIEEQAKALGAPTVRTIHMWARDHVESGLGADIQWVRGETVKSRLYLDSASLRSLMDVLDQTVETKTEIIEVDGVIAGGEAVKKHRFHFIADSGEDITGTYTDAISEASPVTWPKRYRARIQKTTKIFYTSDKEETASYALLSLEPLG